MSSLFTPPRLKTYADLFINISAAYFMATAISVNFTSFNRLESLLIFLQYLISGIMFLFAAIKIEEFLYYGKFF